MKNKVQEPGQVKTRLAFYYLSLNKRFTKSTWDLATSPSFRMFLLRFFDFLVRM